VDYARKSVKDAVGNLVADDSGGREVMDKLALSKVVGVKANDARV
jgi:hypothetical protein